MCLQWILYPLGMDGMAVPHMLIAGGCAEDKLQYPGVFEFNVNNDINETGKALGSAKIY